jgi:hypothetical protein
VYLHLILYIESMNCTHFKVGSGAVDAMQTGVQTGIT